jgi:nicotinamidase-related amidase
MVFGVATEFCVLAAVLELCGRGYKVDVVTDAIRPITEDGGRAAMEKMLAAGARMVSTAEVCNPATMAATPIP